MAEQLNQSEVAMDIHKSLNVILANGCQFAEGFYRRFAIEHPMIYRHFDGMNMKLQAHLLTTALTLIVCDFEKDTESIKEYLQVLGTRHHHRSIDKSDFVAWEDTLLAVLGDYHGLNWNDELARQWRTALNKAIDRMLLGYAAEHHI